MRRGTEMERSLDGLWSDQLSLPKAWAGSILNLRRWRVLKPGGCARE